MNNTQKEHLNLLCDIDELISILSESANIRNFLQRTVEMVAKHLKADVCSIYLYEEKFDDLVLMATIGLNPEAVEKIRIKPGEGLVGLSMKQFKPVCEGDACNCPNFKYFEEAKEDDFNSLLAVPIQWGLSLIGVLVVQDKQPHYFDKSDVIVLRALSSQLAGSLENARSLLEFQKKEKQTPKDNKDSSQFIKGKKGVSGYAFAPSTVFKRHKSSLISIESNIPQINDIPKTLPDLYKAIKITGEQLKELQAKFIDRLPESASLIFDAHFMILKDPGFISKIEKNIETGMCASTALRKVAQHYINLFAESPNSYTREKVTDIEDLSLRILKNLYHENSQETIIDKNKIVIAASLYPSDILKLASYDIQGIILVGGGITSHVTILSRSLKIPLIITDDSKLLGLPEDVPILLDGDLGNIYINPSQKVIEKFEAKNQLFTKVISTHDSVLPITKTKDNVQIHLMANINLLSEAKLAKQLKAEGIGLYRTEFPFLIRNAFPPETAQYIVYKKLIEEMGNRSVTMRTLDVGGDKMLSYSEEPEETNPELGLRSIRFSLKYTDVFKQQIRAILRAGANSKKLKIMFPMISSLDEFIEAKKIINECIASLEEEQFPHNANPSIGIMAEVPSIIEIINVLAQEVDFISIGTNDFVQYMLAADRISQNVADYYQPYHPSVLRALAKIANAAHKAQKEISVCGEIAHEPQYIPFLLGIGIRNLSIDPQFIPEVQKFINRLEINKAEKYAKQLLKQVTLKGTISILNKCK